MINITCSVQATTRSARRQRTTRASTTDPMTTSMMTWLSWITFLILCIFPHNNNNVCNAFVHVLLPCSSSSRLLQQTQRTTKKSRIRQKNGQNDQPEGITFLGVRRFHRHCNLKKKNIINKDLVLFSSFRSMEDTMNPFTSTTKRNMKRMAKAANGDGDGDASDRSSNDLSTSSTTSTTASTTTSNGDDVSTTVKSKNNKQKKKKLIFPPYESSLFDSSCVGVEWNKFVQDYWYNNTTTATTSPTTKEEFEPTPTIVDPLWEQVKLEAMEALGPEPEAGPQLYQFILSKSSLLESIVTVIANEIATELMPATAILNLFLELLDPSWASSSSSTTTTTTTATRTEQQEEATDELNSIENTMTHTYDPWMIHADVLAAVACSSSSTNTALTAILFHQGLHALVCYRAAHCLWKANRKGLAYYLQSTVSRRYSADIHPAATLGMGIYLCSAAGVVIGETCVTGNDVSIYQGVTLGGTGKERGDRHPKVGSGVKLEDGATVLGNIPVGQGAIVRAKSIVTKPVSPLAIVSGVPARVQGYRTVATTNSDNYGSDTNDDDNNDSAYKTESWDRPISVEEDDFESFLRYKYYGDWKDIVVDEDGNMITT